jgi:2-dehydro-3-deoxygluconokinase
MAEPRFDVTSFGEMMLRLSVPSGQRLQTATNMNLYPAGAEANVMGLLARLDRKTSWNGTLPENPIGQLCANHLRMAGVDLNQIIWKTGGRLGTYYVEFGEPPRGIQVTYDRAHSDITSLQSNEINWDTLLDTRILHLTGITPALSPSCHEIVVAALDKARDKKTPVSFDVNYRQKLWSETEARDAVLPMIQNVELLFCSQADAVRLFGCKGEMDEIAESMLDISHAKHAVITFGTDGILLWDGEVWKHEPARPTKMIDRLGAGDALAAGVLHGWLEGNIVQGAKYGVTLAALALSQLGDMVITDKKELASLINARSTLTR